MKITVSRDFTRPEEFTYEVTASNGDRYWGTMLGSGGVVPTYGEEELPIKIQDRIWAQYELDIVAHNEHLLRSHMDPTLLRRHPDLVPRLAALIADADSN